MTLKVHKLLSILLICKNLTIIGMHSKRIDSNTNGIEKLVIQNQYIKKIKEFLLETEEAITRKKSILNALEMNEAKLDKEEKAFKIKQVTNEIAELEETIKLMENERNKLLDMFKKKEALNTKSKIEDNNTQFMEILSKIDIMKQNQEVMNDKDRENSKKEYENKRKKRINDLKKSSKELMDKFKANSSLIKISENERHKNQKEEIITLNQKLQIEYKKQISLYEDKIKKLKEENEQIMENIRIFYSELYSYPDERTEELEILNVFNYKHSGNQTEELEKTEKKNREMEEDFRKEKFKAILIDQNTSIIELNKNIKHIMIDMSLANDLKFKAIEVRCDKLEKKLEEIVKKMTN
jgi:hypothetical protein